MTTCPASLAPLLDTPVGSMRLAWRNAEWHRLTPVLHAWAHVAIPARFALSADEVDDVVAETIRRAWLSSDVPDNPKSWTMRVARNAAIDRLKSQDRSRRRQSVAGGDLDHLPAESEDVGDRLDYALRETRLRRAMARLPEPLRRCVFLRYLKSRPYETIADILGITVGAAKMRTTRGLAYLRALYFDEPWPRLTAAGRPDRRAPKPKPVPWRVFVQQQQRERGAWTRDIAFLTAPLGRVHVLPRA